VILEHASAPGRLAFHVHERCALPAFKALVGGEPGAWIATVRHIDAEMN